MEKTCSTCQHRNDHSLCTNAESVFFGTRVEDGTCQVWENYEEEFWGSEYYNQLKILVQLGGSIPNPDLVPVVRCMECKHYKEFRTRKNKQIMRLCYRMGKHDMEYPVRPDDFCSYGERRNTDAE